MNTYNRHRLPHHDEAVSLDTTIAHYTVNAAFVLHQEDITGSPEVGKCADLIIVDHNIFEVPSAEILGTHASFRRFSCCKPFFTAFFLGQSRFDLQHHRIDVSRMGVQLELPEQLAIGV